MAGVDHTFGRPELRRATALAKAIERLPGPWRRAPVGGGAAEVESATAVPGVPVIEMTAPAGGSATPLAVVLSGDGGWAGVDREVAKVLAGQRGVLVDVGLDTLEYFWNARTPATPAPTSSACCATT